MLLHGKVKGRISVKLSIMWLFGWAWFLMLRTIRIRHMMKIIMSMVDGNDDDDDFSFCDNSKSFVFRIYIHIEVQIHTYIHMYIFTKWEFNDCAYRGFHFVVTIMGPITLSKQERLPKT